MDQIINSLGPQLGGALLNLVWAIAILIVGWIIATVVASVIKGLLHRTDLDNRIAAWISGGSETFPIETWIAAFFYWLILLLTVLGALNALNLAQVSQPINALLEPIFSYLPRIALALVLLGVAWAIATVVKLIVTRVLTRFRLDDQLTGQTGDSPFLINETLGEVLYWFIFLLFLLPILEALGLENSIQPVEDLLSVILTYLPQIASAAFIVFAGWLVARLARMIVTNLLTNLGVDRLGQQLGVSADPSLSLANLVGNVVYALILIAIAIQALATLDIDAISTPATIMLQQVATAIPNIFAAALILVVFYILGQFVKQIVTSVLQRLGFDNVLQWLGWESFIQSRGAEPSVVVDPSAVPTPVAPPSRPATTPSELVGIVVFVGIMLFAVVTATERLQFETLTVIVEAIIAISGQVIVAVLIFAVGWYVANLAFRVISQPGNSQMNLLAQTARIFILAFVGAMALQRLGIATSIVNLAFGLFAGAIALGAAIAFGIAFGWGGRETAAETVRQVADNLRGNNNDPNQPLT